MNIIFSTMHINILPTRKHMLLKHSALENKRIKKYSKKEWLFEIDFLFPLQRYNLSINKTNKKPKIFGLLKTYDYLCTYESQKLPKMALFRPDACIGRSIHSTGRLESEDQISWWEILYLALHPQGQTRFPLLH